MRLVPTFTSLLALPLALALALALTATPARAADPPPVHAYGVLVGTNVGGPGQQPLRYAEDDARRVADVLRELGHFGTSDLRVLIRPDARTVLAAIDDAAARAKADRARGEQAIVVFYYSGHARTNAFDLGNEELPIATLRDRLRALPSTLTLAVLDACQSGQFVRVKGAEPAADFSFNSVSHLTTKGIAVMASSTAQELSQESDQLKASYFTHHLVVGLRGAADADGDGRVSLDEAYRYAYRRTLASTAQTQVGMQHVTLDTDLAGQGEVPLTFPAAARSQLEFPAVLSARVLVTRLPSGSVVAEVQKAPGAPLRLALPAGEYEAIVRPEHGVLRCRLAVADETTMAIDIGACEALRDAPTVVKGDGDASAGGPASSVTPDAAAGGESAHTEARVHVDPFTVEGSLGVIVRSEDAYTRRLEDFGYKANRGLLGKAPRYRVGLAVFKGIVPHLAVGLELHTLAGDEYARVDVGGSNDTFDFDAYGATWWARLVSVPLGGVSTNVDFYGQVGGGVVLGITKLTSDGSVTGTPQTETTHDTYLGWEAAALAGVRLHLHRAALFAQGGYEYAPAIANLLGDTHNSGGPSVELGLSVRF